MSEAVIWKVVEFRIRSRKGSGRVIRNHRLCSYTAGIAEGNDVVVGVGSIEFVFIRAAGAAPV